MRIAHLADIHLGYRAYNRVTRQGLNCREADVFNAFRQALAKVVEIQPDLIVIAGDLFHSVRPSNLCIERTFAEFVELRTRSEAPIVLIGGNHDSPRSVETGCILDLFQNIPRTFVVHRGYSAVEIPELAATVFCLCHSTIEVISSLKIEPNPSSRYNVLAVHGTLEGIGQSFYDTVPPITRSLVLRDDWDYIALGHYHINEKLADNAYYSGSTEFTSFNIWQETERPKGFIEFDLDERRLVGFHEVDTRDVVDLRPVDGDGLSGGELDGLIRARLEGVRGGHEEKILRLVVQNIPRAIIPDLDYRAIRQFRSEALHFDLKFLPPKKEALRSAAGNSHAARSLEEEWREFALSYEAPGGVDREELVARGLEYLAAQE